ncbi:MAG: M20 family metallopeptidase [Rhodospirillaceae bacterium]|nr:M20 family metallopeptidase [Rhodospirillaceae bacterium]
MTRQAVIDRLLADFDDGDFVEELTRRVAIPTESQVPESFPHLHRYLAEEIAPELDRMGYETQIIENPVEGGGPFLIGRRIEGEDLPNVVTYGHGDVVRGLEGDWREDRDPWTIDIDGDRIYGRGTVDNKGQHTINMRALKAVIEERGHLGFNSIFIMETSEEIGSPGVHEFCTEYRDQISGDVLIASDGPRVAPDKPSLWLGSRGAINFDLSLKLREGGNHSGNWGGLLANPGVILANAISAIIDRNGHVSARGIMPEAMPNSIRAALAEIKVDPGEGGPEINDWYGERNLTPTERVFGWNTFEILAMRVGNPDNPVNAVPPDAIANCQIRYTVDRDRDELLPALRTFLAEAGYPEIEVSESAGRSAWGATRMDAGDPWVGWTVASIEKTLGQRPAILPNIGASLPNDAFVDILGLSTVYVPHSYAGCSQHAPNEHGLLSIFREGLAMMGGIFWDLGEAGTPKSRD